MKFDTVLIKVPVKDFGWQVSQIKSDLERQPTKTTPNPLGFYHYPRRMGFQRAFNKLREYMISERQAVIDRLQQEIDSLRSLEPGEHC